MESFLSKLHYTHGAAHLPRSPGGQHAAGTFGEDSNKATELVGVEARAKVFSGDSPLICRGGNEALPQGEPQPVVAISLWEVACLPG